jgi:benzil reductase ((S)-benzoin forming)
MALHHYFITGTSSGIGKAIAEQLIQREDHFVTGLSRTCSITHPRYEHFALDLADQKQVNEWKFPLLFHAKKIVLINNAGMVGNVRYSGRAESQTINEVINVNLSAAMVLTNNFLKTYFDHPAKQVILNISSGAGKNPIDGWSAYCASKAGLDMFTKVVAEEIRISGRPETWVFSVGVVDTKMQDEIRSANLTEFSQKQRFIDYKNSSQLADPLLTAAKYCAILETPEKFKEVIFSVKDIGG